MDYQRPETPQHEARGAADSHATQNAPRAQESTDAGPEDDRRYSDLSPQQKLNALLEEQDALIDRFYHLGRKTMAELSRTILQAKREAAESDAALNRL